MSKSIKLLSAIIVLLLNVPVISAEAKSSYELDKEADKLDSHAANKEAAAGAERTRTSLAVDEGKKGTAAKHAKQAAKEQKDANELENRADKIKDRADKKAVKETY